MPPKQQKKSKRVKRKQAKRNRKQARETTTQVVHKALKELKLSGGNNAALIAKAVALPRDSRPIRLPLQSTIGTRTAITNFLYAGGTVARNAELGPVEDEIASHTWVLTRSPVAPLWETVSITTSVDTALWTLEIRPAYVENNVSGFVVDNYTVLASLANHVPPVASVPFMNVPLVYLPYGSRLTYAVTGSNVSTTLLVTLISHRGLDYINEQPVNLATDASGAGSVTPNLVPGWYGIKSIDLQSSTNLLNTTRISIFVKATAAKVTALLPSFTPYEVENAQLLYSQARLNASTLLISNTTPQLRRGGRFIAARLPGGTVNFADWSQFYNAIGKANSTVKYEGKGDLGCYTWTLPDQKSMQFSDYYIAYGTTRFVAINLADFDFFNVVMYLGGVMSDTATDKAAVQTFSTEVDFTIEFCPNTQLLPLAVPRFHYSDYEAAVTTLARTPPFRENPGHWAAIARMMHQLAGYVGPSFLKGLRAGGKAMALDVATRL